MPNFDKLKTASSANLLLKAATPDFIAVNAAYMAGDHFQNGNEWVGPEPPPTMRGAAIARLQKSWCPSPVINEMIENHTVGVVGHEPLFQFVPARPLADGEEYSADESDAVDSLNSHIGQWWDERNGLAILQEWTSRLRWAGRGSLRLFVPPDLMQEGEEGFALPPDVTTPEQALDYIYFEAPNAEAATVYNDPRTRRNAGIYSYDEEVTAEGKTENKKRVEIAFVADADEPGIARGATVLRIVQEDIIVAQISFPCGGQNLIYEAALPLLFTNPVRRLQQSLNMINTMLPINDAYAGFRKHDYINVEPPRDEAGKEVPPTSGPSQFMMWYSAPYYEVDDSGRRTGEVKYFPPQLITTEPVDSSNIREDCDHFDRLIRRFCKQEYTLLAGDGSTSAVALIQKRAVFANDLLRTAPAVEGALRWLQTAVWCFALYLSGNESQIESFMLDYRATAKSKIYTGPLTPDEIRVVLERLAAGTLSKETALAMLGDEDIDAELGRIKAEQSEEYGLVLQPREAVAPDPEEVTNA